MLDYTALNALRAVLRCGSFEAAAAQLGVTGSAVSQRIKTLEDRMGAPLVLRSQPTRATALGARLARHAEDVAAMERDLFDAAQAAPSTIRIATPADVLATWLIDALSQVEGLLFDLVVDDQDHSTDWLRKGEVAAAITSRAAPVQGCDSRPLGQMRYLATASPAFAARWFPDGVTPAAAARAPMVEFNEKDRLQEHWLRAQLGAAPPAPAHRIPASQGFAHAAEAGLGWGMNPDMLIDAALRAGRLVPLSPDPWRVPLYWQGARASARTLAPVLAAVRQVAQMRLDPIPPEGAQTQNGAPKDAVSTR